MSNNRRHLQLFLILSSFSILLILFEFWQIVMPDNEKERSFRGPPLNETLSKTKSLKISSKTLVLKPFEIENLTKTSFENNSLIDKKVLNWSRIYSKKNFTLLPKQYEEMVENPNSSFTCGSKNLLRPWFHFKQAETKDMIFFIKAAPKHFRQREVIRDSWGKIRMLFDKKFATIFVVARTKDDSVQRDLEKENEQYGDMLQCDYVDSYRSLPIKVLSTFRWIIENNINSSYYTMTDDDFVMDLKEIVRFLQSEQPQNYLHCGFKFSEVSNPVRRGREEFSKWYIKTETYSKNVYPGFCHGGMYTLQRHLVEDLYSVSRWTKLGNFHLEDVYVTGILRYKLGFGNTNIQPYQTESKVSIKPMYYSFKEGEEAFKLIAQKWKSFNQTLPWKPDLDSTRKFMKFYDWTKDKTMN